MSPPARLAATALCRLRRSFCRLRSTASGSRVRTAQYASAEQLNPAKRTTWVQAVLPCNTWSKKAHTVLAGPNLRSRQVWPTSRQVSAINSAMRNAATLHLICATACTILPDMVGPLVGVFVNTPTILAGGPTSSHLHSHHTPC